MHRSSKQIKLTKIFILVMISFSSAAVQGAGLALSPGVTTDIIDKIDQIEDENLREMLRTSVFPGFVERSLNLPNRPEETLNAFEKNYKTYPLNWDEQLENVRFLLDNTEDIAKLTPENLVYKDIEFGEAIIPVTDKRVKDILRTTYLDGEIQRLDEEKQMAMATLYKTETVNVGPKLQALEDEYALKLARLNQAENEYKKAKVEFLKLSNKKENGRIDDETYQTQTRQIVENFEQSFVIGSEVSLFDAQKIKQLGSSIYDSSIKIAPSPTVNSSLEKAPRLNQKAYYWTIALVLMVGALGVGYLAFRKIHHSKKFNI